MQFKSLSTVIVVVVRRSLARGLGAEAGAGRLRVCAGTKHPKRHRHHQLCCRRPPAASLEAPRWARMKGQGCGSRSRSTRSVYWPSVLGRPGRTSGAVLAPSLRRADRCATRCSERPQCRLNRSLGDGGCSISTQTEPSVVHLRWGLRDPWPRWEALAGRTSWSPWTGAFWTREGLGCWAKAPTLGRPSSRWSDSVCCRRSACRRRCG